MICFLQVILLSSFSLFAYVPTVESLFRHGSNPDVSANGVSLTLVVTQVTTGEKRKADSDDASLAPEQNLKDYYRIFFTKSADALKVAQTRYSSSNFAESELIHKIYYPNFNPYTVKSSIESLEKGIFISLLHSLVFNNGSHIISYLKSLGVPLRLNNEIINREKIELLADYKRYLVAVKNDRSAKKSLSNPMKPDDASSRERAENIMRESMYSDLKQVRLSKDQGQLAWVVSAGAFEAVFTFKERDAQRVLYKSNAGDFEIILKDYWLANGTHALPKYLLVKTFNGEQFQVEITNLRHYIEREDDLIKRLKAWDVILKGKDSAQVRPEFLL